MICYVSPVAKEDDERRQKRKNLEKGKQKCQLQWRRISDIRSSVKEGRTRKKTHLRPRYTPLRFQGIHPPGTIHPCLAIGPRSHRTRATNSQGASSVDISAKGGDAIAVAFSLIPESVCAPCRWGAVAVNCIGFKCQRHSG